MLINRVCFRTMNYKNIIFDLGGVVFARDRSKCSEEFQSFFSFVSKVGTPLFWDEYDRGTLSFDEVKAEICRFRQCDLATCEAMIDEAIGRQEEMASTCRLVAELKQAGYKLYVLSNMSREFIDFLRRLPVYKQFDGEVVSCEVGFIKPEREIYEILLSRYGLSAAESLFIDDRQANLDGAKNAGIEGFLFDSRNPEVSCSELRSLLLD